MARVHVGWQGRDSRGGTAWVKLAGIDWQGSVGRGGVAGVRWQGLVGKTAGVR